MTSEQSTGPVPGANSGSPSEPDAQNGPAAPQAPSTEPGAVAPEALATRGRIRTRAWTAVARGLYRASHAEDTVVAARHAWAQALPDQGCFTHLTAAAIHGLWLPPLPDSLPVFGAARRGGPWPKRPGLVISRHPWDPPRTFQDGLPVSTIPETLLACARDLGTVDLVLLLDSALRAGQTPAELAAVATRGRPGAPGLRRALAFADSRSESPWETVLRLLHVSAAIEVHPQFEVHDESGFVCRADLRVGDSRVLHEYDGGDHLTRQRQVQDLRRLRRIDRAGWRRHGYTSRDVLHQAGTILREADEAVGRKHLPDRVNRWHEWLRDSLLTPAGTTAFAERLTRRTGFAAALRAGTTRR